MSILSKAVDDLCLVSAIALTLLGALKQPYGIS
jgi:hypothetical protein